MKKAKFCLLILIVLSSALIAQAQTVNFRGNIGTAKLQMILMRSGNELSGTYFYEKQGSTNKLNLKGSVQTDGNFTLTETDGSGKQTGSFKGKWTDDETTIGTDLEGTWTSPAGKESPFSALEQNINFTGNTSFVTRKIAENNKLKMFEIDAEYPEITGLAASPGATKFNLAAKQVVTGLVADFRKDMLARTAEDLAFAKKNGVGNYIDAGYSVVYANDDLVSIYFSNDTFEGGAHPNHNSVTLNYDLKSGRELKLSDLFQPKSNYLKVISDYSIASLKKQAADMSDDEWLNNGAGPKAENFRSWNINNKGLTINFDPYQVAAYAAGPQEVTIPFSALKSVLKQDGLLLSLAK